MALSITNSGIHCLIASNRYPIIPNLLRDTPSVTTVFTPATSGRKTVPSVTGMSMAASVQVRQVRYGNRALKTSLEAPNVEAIIRYLLSHSGITALTISWTVAMNGSEALRRLRAVMCAASMKFSQSWQRYVPNACGLDATELYSSMNVLTWCSH